jgi:hypothetical protein
MSHEEDEVLVSTDGYEGRFAKWSGNAWEAFDYANYRHWFSPPQPLGPHDLEAIRRKFEVPSSRVSDADLISTAPSTLRHLEAPK